MKKRTRTTTEKPFGSSWWPLGCPLPGTEAWERLPWPAAVPVLKARDVCVNHVIPLTKPPFNLDGWLDAVFFEREVPGRGKHDVENVAHIVVEVTLFKTTGRRLASWEYAHMGGVSLADVADVWNQAMTLLGYDMSRPRKVKKKKDDYSEFFS
jgi:hypothetical protein